MPPPTFCIPQALQIHQLRSERLNRCLLFLPWHWCLTCSNRVDDSQTIISRDWSTLLDVINSIKRLILLFIDFIPFYLKICWFAWFVDADWVESTPNWDGDFIISISPIQSVDKTIILPVLGLSEPLIYERVISFIWNLKINLNPINSESRFLRLKSCLALDQSISSFEEPHAPNSRCPKKREMDQLLIGWICRIKLWVCIPIKRNANQILLKLQWLIWIWEDISKHQRRGWMK